MTKHKHKFAGEDEASKLVSWLNSGHSDGRNRVIEIAELYSKLGKSVPPPERKTSAGALSLRLWMLLDRYTFKLDNRGSVTGLIPAAKLPQYESDWLEESENVLRVQSLRQIDLLARVKHCAHCNRWMFAKVLAQRFCRESCRIKVYQSDKKWIKRNNAARRAKYLLRKQNPNILIQQRRGAL